MKKLIFLMLLISLAACEEVEIFDTKFDLDGNVVEAAIEGGDYEISYTLSNAQAEGRFEWESSCGWVEVNSIADGKVSLSVETNETGEPRDALVDIKYLPLGLKKTINVYQAGPDGQQEYFTISIDKLYENSAYLKISPENINSNYIISNISDGLFMEMSSDKEIFDHIMQEYKDAAESHGMDLMDYMHQSGALRKGVSSVFFDWLNVGAGYNAVAVGVSQEGFMSTPVTVLKYSTESYQVGGTTFEVHAEVQLPNANITIDPSDENVYYYYVCVLKDEFEQTGLSAAQYIQNEIYENLHAFGFSTQQFNPDVFAKKGSYSTRISNLTASSEYLFLVCAVKERALIDSEVTEFEFETESVQPSDNIITVSVDNVTKFSAEYHVRTTNDDPYVCICVAKSEIEGKTEDEIFTYLSENYSMKGYSYKGDMDEFIEPLEPETEYAFVAFGYFAGVKTTDMVYEYFKTKGDSNPEDLTFEYKVSNIQAFSADIEISGTPASAYYFWDVVTSDLTGDDVKALVDEVIQSWIDYGWYEDRAEYMERFRSVGRETVTYDQLDPNTSYKIFAFGVYEDTGDYATEVQFSEPFDTPQRQISPSEIQLSYDKYFDGSQLRDKYPDLTEAAEGMTVVPVTVTPSGEYVHYYSSFAPVDYFETLNEGMIISSLLTLGNADMNVVNCLCNYDAEYVFFAITEDADGNYSEISTIHATFTRDGVSPVEDFPMQPQNSGMLLSKLNQSKLTKFFRID